MVLKKTYCSRRGNSVTKLIIILGFLLIVGFGGSFWFVNAQDKTTDSKGQEVSVKMTALVTNTDQSTWTKLRDQNGSFDVEYPKPVFKKNFKQVTSPLPNQEKVKAVELAHFVVVKDCNLGTSAENCLATTTDIAISFFTIDRNFNDILKDLRRTYGQEMPVITVDGHQGVSFAVGDGIKGLIYRVLPINNTKTLFISRSYLDLNQGSVQSDDGFIPLTAQKALFEQIMSTFTFRPTI